MRTDKFLEGYNFKIGIPGKSRCSILLEYIRAALGHAKYEILSYDGTYYVPLNYKFPICKKSYKNIS
jgi:hypothetical protein